MNPSFIAELRRIVGDTHVLDDALELLTYECDALPHLREQPAAVALPGSAAEVQAIVRLCRRDGVPFVARGHGTGLSGGALPIKDGVLIGLSRMSKILDVDIPNLRAVVEPGVTNLDITKRVAPFGCYYAPDPSSQVVCSIGGNIAENSGGAHCLKYGFTVHHVVGVEAVLPNGDLVHIGGPVLDQAQRDRIWKGRKAAFAAMGRVSPNYYVQDGVVPRTKLPEVLRRIRDLEARSGLRIGNVFHAGDGNLHPLICYDGGIAGQAEHAEKVAAEILTYCIDAGGAITGEHGVGVDKKNHMPKMFAEHDLDTMQLVRCAFDPTGICNPGKVFPTPRLCGEVPGPYRQHPVERAGLAERF